MQQKNQEINPCLEVPIDIKVLEYQSDNGRPV